MKLLQPTQKNFAEFFVDFSLEFEEFINGEMSRLLDLGRGSEKGLKLDFVGDFLVKHKISRAFAAEFLAQYESRVAREQAPSLSALLAEENAEIVSNLVNKTSAGDIAALEEAMDMILPSATIDDENWKIVKSLDALEHEHPEIFGGMADNGPSMFNGYSIEYAHYVYNFFTSLGQKDDVLELGLLLGHETK